MLVDYHFVTQMFFKKTCDCDVYQLGHFTLVEMETLSKLKQTYELQFLVIY